MHQAVDAAVAAQYDGDAFVTGVFARLQVDTGALTWTNAGHPVPLLLRDRRVVGPLPCEPSPPFGLAGVVPTVQVEALEPGDTVLLYTDGVTDARTSEGASSAWSGWSTCSSGRRPPETPPEETLRRLIRSTLEFQGGELRDDATLVLLQWSGAAAPREPVVAAAERIGLTQLVLAAAVAATIASVAAGATRT